MPRRHLFGGICHWFAPLTGGEPLTSEQQDTQNTHLLCLL